MQEVTCFAFLKRLSTELFSVPTLTMHPAEVFQNDNMTLTCKSRIHVPQRLSENEMNYSLNATEVLHEDKGNGVFLIKTPLYDSNYRCKVEAKDIEKYSEILTVHPKGNSNGLVTSERSSSQTDIIKLHSCTTASQFPGSLSRCEHTVTSSQC